MRAIAPRTPCRPALALALIGATTAAAHAQPPRYAPLASAPRVVTPDPRVPRAAGTPCVVQLFETRPFGGEGEYTTDNHFTYMPPPACPPPWAKVVLKLDIASSRHTVVDDIGVSLADIPLLRQAAPRYDAPARWHAERDLTDYSALLRVPRTGTYWTTQGEEAIDPGGQTPPFTGSARLLFYPSTARTPAPRVPDTVLRLDGGTPINLPHNIVRAYADVDNAAAWWYFCLPSAEFDAHPALFDYFAPSDTLRNSIFPHETGCRGSSYREIRVDVDGTPAGIAPVFPLLPADPSIDYLHNPLDRPTPTPRMLGTVPYRVDLTPFAGQLDAAGRHLISAPGVLLLYLDPRRTLVTGGVTLNTLAGSPAAPTYTSTLTNHGEGVRGRVVTRQARTFEIRGFVNTSHGRIDASVRQSDRFENIQAIDIRGPHRPFPGETVDKLYQQALVLRSTTERISRRTRGATVLGKDVEHFAYPLAYIYHMATTVADEGDGWYVTLRNGTVVAGQNWWQGADRYRAGRGHYRSQLEASFEGSRTQAWGYSAWRSNQPADSHWQSLATHRFTDNFGSCFQAAVRSANGAVTSTTRGSGCPDGHNRVRWFAHPDGTPDSLGWWH